MSIENIGFSPANISLDVGDDIVDNTGKIFEVVYIDYERLNIIVVSSFGDDVSGIGATVLPFGIVACNYHKVIGD